MKKIIKNLMACLGVLIIVFGSAGLLVGCNKGKSNNEGKVMNVALNPGLEFVLDKNDNVVSVTATNDDGNYVLTQVNFEGMTAEEAVNKFIEVANESGFVVPGEVSVGENELKISISGEDAKKLFDQVKASAVAYMEENDIAVRVDDFVKITKEKLQQEVAVCLQELSSTEIAQLSEKELVELLKQSHEETKNLLSQELKDLYYSQRANEIISAKFEQLKTIFAECSGVLALVYTQFTEGVTALTSKISSFTETFEELLLKGDEDYQVKMQEYLTAKKELLSLRLEEVLNEEAIAEAEAALTSVETELAQLKEAAMDQVELLKTQIATQIASINSMLTQMLEIVESFVGDLDAQIEDAIAQAKTELKSSFASEYQTQIQNAKESWESLKPETGSAA